MRICSQFTWEFSVVSKCEDTVNILCYHTSQAPDLGDGYSQKNWIRVCGPLPKTLTLFMFKIYDFPCPIYDLTKNSIPYIDLTLNQ